MFRPLTRCSLREQIPLTKACGSQCNREALYSPFVPLQYTHDLLGRIPSLKDPSKSVEQEINKFNAVPGNKTYVHARLVGKSAAGPEVIDVETMGLNAKERGDLLRIATKTEKQLGTIRINECFEKNSSRRDFGTCGIQCKSLEPFRWGCAKYCRFAFQLWHSAVEFHRYLHRFIQEFPRVNSPAGVDRTPYNQYDSIILPLETYLKSQDVHFQYSTLIKALSCDISNFSQTRKLPCYHSFQARILLSLRFITPLKLAVMASFMLKLTALSLSLWDQ